MDPNLTPVPLDAGALTDEQRDGTACVVCGSATAAMRPVGTVNRVQVFACTAHDATWPDGEPAAVRDLAERLADGDDGDSTLISNEGDIATRLRDLADRNAHLGREFADAGEVDLATAFADICLAWRAVADALHNGQNVAVACDRAGQAMQRGRAALDAHTTR